MYIHEQKKWPDFEWDGGALAQSLTDVRHQQGRLLGRMEALGFPQREEATLRALTQDVLKSSEIEGEKLPYESVRSSIARRLGVDVGTAHRAERSVEGIVEIMVDATRNYERALTKERLTGWHAALFPTARSGMKRIAVGRWRLRSSDPMQVVSGPYGREKIHYEAPSADRLNSEMARFLKWANAKSATDPVLKSAVAHFWFVTVHPFEDGNGRIGRAIADMMLARSEGSPQRFYSMSAQIERERNSYYDVLERCQKGSLDITPWMSWFLDCLRRAIDASEVTLGAVLTKAKFWKIHEAAAFNDRQKDLINRLLDGFDGKLTSSKWAKIAKCSQDTALRDIADLLDRKILVKEEAGGRSTHYRLASFPV